MNVYMYINLVKNSYTRFPDKDGQKTRDGEKLGCKKFDRKKYS